MYGFVDGSCISSGEALSDSAYLFARLLAASFFENSDFSIVGFFTPGLTWTLLIGLYNMGLKAPRFLDYGDSGPGGSFSLIYGVSGCIGFETLLAL